MKVTINGLPPRDWQARFSRRAQRKIGDSLRASIERVLLNIERLVKTSTYAASGLRTRTGHLKRNIGSGPQGVRRVSAPRRFGSKIRVTGLIGSRVIYAGVQEHGATIVARNAPRLVFEIPGVGVRTAKSVTIPARPYLGPATRRVRADQVITKHVQQAVDESV
jgi:hypothetical protein